MSIKSYERFTEYSRAEIAVLVMYHREYIKSLKGGFSPIELFDLGYKLSVLDSYIIDLVSLSNPFDLPRKSEEEIRNYFEGIESKFPEMFDYAFKEYDLWLESLSVEEMYSLTKTLESYSYAKKYFI